jgi:hypothetical protein
MEVLEIGCGRGVAVRPRVGRIAAGLLSAFCLMSVLFGLFDGDLIANVSADGFFSVGVAWAGVLLAATAVVGLLALARARELYARRGADERPDFSA